MPRIPEAEVERLKEEVSVQRLVEAAGVELKKAGKDWLGRCPFHDDREASLVVTPAKNLWHCFGCQIGGGPIDWVIKSRGVSFRHAVELLKDDAGLAACAAVDGEVKRSKVRTLPSPVAFDADDQALVNQTIDYYHQRLKESPEALAYLQARGLTHAELIATFKLGVADRTLGLRLPDKSRKAGAEIRARLQKIGLIRESGHPSSSCCAGKTTWRPSWCCAASSPTCARSSAGATARAPMATRATAATNAAWRVRTTSGWATRGCSSRTEPKWFSAGGWRRLHRHGRCSSTAAAASDAAQAEDSACTAPGQRLGFGARQGFASPRCALDPITAVPVREAARQLKKEAPGASSRVRVRPKPLQGVSAATLAGMSALTGLRPA
ncbi:MAG: hypothetical protein HUU30_13155 [Burkholderiaceae bacterium]|nr:CHC2 zinc finger domain-containing protein [Aquabacterium sp.]NUP86681.1 hypothetical protein [Burkholderiaceae bacterium]